MNKDETAYCMSFCREEYLNPERSANDWMDEKNRHHPGYIAQHGYHVVKKQNLSHADKLSLKAADLLQEIIDKERL